LSDVSVCCTAGHWMDIDENDICAACKDHTEFIDDEYFYVQLGIAWYNNKSEQQVWIVTPSDYENAVQIEASLADKVASIPYNHLMKAARAMMKQAYLDDFKDMNIVHVWVENEL
jgi:hypothetical protein